jgi:hypothetical protein
MAGDEASYFMHCFLIQPYLWQESGLSKKGLSKKAITQRVIVDHRIIEIDLYAPAILGRTRVTARGYLSTESVP